MKYLFLAISALFSPVLYPWPVFSKDQDARFQDYYCRETSKPFFAEADGKKGRFTPQRKAAQPDGFLMPKQAGTRRVFIIGESVATLLGPGKSLSGGSSAGGNPGIEIINCGMGGYESYRIHGVLEEVLKYSPDLVVVMSGNNDTKEESCPGLRFDLRRRKFRLFEKYFSLKNTGSEARKKAFLKMHGAMLSSMAGSAKKAGVPIVFCTLPAAVRDMPPRQPIPFENRNFALGYRLFYSGKYEEALKNFELGLAEDPREPFLNFYAAKSFERLARGGEAAVHYNNAIDFEAAMSRSGRERNDLIRRTAAAEGACVADLDSLFRSLAPDGLPGFTEFTDGMHWNLPYNKQVWEEIFRAAGRCGIKGFNNFNAGSAGKWAETSRGTALKRLSYAFAWTNEKDFSESSLAELARIRQDQPELLKKAGASPGQLEKLLLKNFWADVKAEPLKDLYPFFLAHLAETERRAGNHSLALSLSDRALSLAPGNLLLKFGQVQILADTGRSKDKFLDLAEDPGLRRRAKAVGAAYGIISAAEPVSRKDAALSKTISDQAIEKIRTEDLKAAEELSLKAVEKNPFNAEALMNLCYILRKDGRTLKALEACNRASSSVYQDPANKTPSLELLSCDAAFESYKLLKALDRDPEAADILTQCVKRAPPSWQGLAAAKAALKPR